MTDGTGPSTKREFRAALDVLVLKAYANGVNIDDDLYTLHHDDSDVPDFAVTISQMTDLAPRENCADRQSP